jgi:hypothetical protein
VNRIGVVSILLVASVLQGCGVANTMQRNEAADYYAQAAPMVQLGISEAAFQALMGPAMEVTKKDKRPTRFSKGGSLYVVYYPRSAEFWDGEITDDEYTPYIFRDGRLVDVGWDAIGGEKYTTRDIREAEQALQRAKAGATQIKVEQNNGGGNDYFKPYCPPSKYPIYGCPPPD